MYSGGVSMELKDFLKLVEIQTKIASVYPFLIGLFFSWSYFHIVNWFYMILFFIAMILFDMTTTAINNYQDYVKAVDEHYKYEENIIGKANLEESTVRKLIFGMGGMAMLIGLILSVLSGWLFFFIGAVCCFIGIFYTFGPIPLSRMPLGEIFSGVTMGIGIPAMTVYLNTFNDKLFFFEMKDNTFALTGEISAVVALVWACLPLVFTIANIMLANNLRDLDTDIVNERFTLVYYLGRPHGIILFEVLMLSCYLVMVVGFVAGVFQWPVLLTLLTLPKAIQTLKRHQREVPHPISFKRSIDNFLLFNTSYVLVLVITVILNAFK